mmetsp:Transcript_13785/g.20483  ORF Transcript_13785/g.20483 Transcript_13785/m.20483 type:complete len:565 (+) Transcript_13785:81-1775(+)
MSEAEEFKAKGNAAQQAGKFDEAIAFYSKAIELDGSNHVYYSNRSAAYLSKSDAENALKDAEKCIQVKPDWPKGFSRKGAALHKLKRFEEAANEYENGLKIAPDDAGLKRGLEEVLKAKTSSSALPSQFNNLFGGNILAKLAGNPKFSSYLADPSFVSKVMALQNNPGNLTGLKDDPRMMEVFSFLLGIDMPRGDNEGNFMDEDDSEAYEERKAEPPAPTKPKETKKEPEKPSADPPSNKAKAVEMKAKGNKFYSSKDFVKAMECYDDAIKLDPSNMTFLLNKAAVYMEMGDFSACQETCQKAIELGRSNRASYDDIAKAYVRSGKAAAKEGNLELAIKQLKSGQVEHYTKETERLIKNMELELRKKAAAAYIDPEMALAAKERGNEHFRNGKWVEAIKEYEEAIKRDPDSPIYRNNLASSLVKIMDFNGAKSAVEKALELDPKYVKAWAKKGDIEFVMKEYHKALESYQRGLGLEPENSLCKSGLQKTLLKINAPGGTADEEKERRAHAMADPEIQAILSDPIVQQVLQDMQKNPMEGQKAMRDPVMGAKIEKLIAAGILQVR